MFKDLLNKKRPDFEKVLEHFLQELSTLRTGRANPGLVENVLVDVYGTKNPLKNLASITIPEPRTITIQPWDKGTLGEIDKALQNSNLGANPVNDGANIRINLPQPSEERRKELVKTLKQYEESARVKVRNIREELWREVGKLHKEKKMTDDDRYEAQEELKKVIDEYNEKIKNTAEKKELDVMAV